MFALNPEVVGKDTDARKEKRGARQRVDLRQVAKSGNNGPQKPLAMVLEIVVEK